MQRWREFAVGLAAGGILAAIALVLFVLPDDDEPAGTSASTSQPTMAASPAFQPPPTLAPTNTPSPEPTASPAPTATPEPATYVVQPGDSLAAICAAEAPDVPDCVEAIVELNGLASADQIEAGQTIELPRAGTAPETPGAAPTQAP